VNDTAWRSFFELLDDPEYDPSPPSYWGNRDDGRKLRTYIRNDSYTIQWNSRSRLEIRIGMNLKDEYGYGMYERLRLPVQGNPKWRGDNGRLEIAYDSVEEAYRVHQSVTVDEVEENEPGGSEAAALDLGANVLVVCTITSGGQYLYSGQTPFEQFRKTTEEIATAQAKLPDGQHTSQRIKRLYRKRSRRRDHAVNTLFRDLIERLEAAGISTLYHGDLTGVHGEYWSVEANLKRKPSGPIGSVSIDSNQSVKSTKSTWKRSRRHGHPRRVQTAVTENEPVAIERRLLARVVSMATRISLLREHYSQRRRTPRSGRRHGPCGSSGTTTSGTPSKGPQ
jgi:putative transposase